MKITIRNFTTYNLELLKNIISGYISNQKYQVFWQDDPEMTLFRLQLLTLETPYIKHFELEDSEYYENIINAGLSLAAYDDRELVALALADYQDWNQSFWVHEFHVLNAYRGQGIGQQLMTALTEKATSVQARTMLCETQNTNIPAIRFYRRMGFKIEAIDTSLYTNTDYPDAEIALFMKRRLIP
jgi:GNAT superfamily N-acetyltransferase